MDYRPPRSSVLGMLQARILEQVATPVFPSPGNHPNPGIKHTSLCLLCWQVGSLPPVPPGTWSQSLEVWVLSCWPSAVIESLALVPSLPTWPLLLFPPFVFLSTSLVQPILEAPGQKLPLPGPLSRLPRGEALSFHSDFPSSIFRPLPPPCGCIVGPCLSASDFQLECNFNKE